LTCREGVSFQGFYYISFHQETGNISGMYFAENSEQYTRIEAFVDVDSNNSISPLSIPSESPFRLLNFVSVF